MRQQFLIPAIFLSSALCFGPALMAQDAPRPYYYGDRAYSEPAPPAGAAASAYDFRAGQSLFATVRTDLDRAENNMPQYSADRFRFDRVRGELSELQRQWDETAYEPSQADKVIRTLDRALASDDIYGRDRTRLTADLDRLRDFRDGHE